MYRFYNKNKGRFAVKFGEFCIFAIRNYLNRIYNVGNRNDIYKQYCGFTG